MLVQPKFWQEKKSLRSTILMPLSYIYQWMGRCRFQFKQPYKADIPVICVGNVTLGGAGKTPIVRLIASLIRYSFSLDVHIVTRGYAGSLKVPTRVMPESDAKLVGDEAILLSKTAPCWIGSNRRDTLIHARKEGSSLVVMDDGFQNPSVYKDISIVVIDGPFGLGNGCVFPAGPLRESLDQALKRADAVIMIGEDKQHLFDHTTSTPVFRARIQLWAQDVAPRVKRAVYAFTGIGRPEKFYNSLREAGVPIVKHRSFPDHYVFSESDIQNIFSEAEQLDLDIVTTEKDYVRLLPHHQSRVYQIRSDILIEDMQLFEKFLNQKLKLIQKNKRNENI